MYNKMSLCQEKIHGKDHVMKVNVPPPHMSNTEAHTVVDHFDLGLQFQHPFLIHLVPEMCKFHFYARQCLQGLRVNLLLFKIYSSHIKNMKECQLNSELAIFTCKRNIESKDVPSSSSPSSSPSPFSSPVSSSAISDSDSLSD